MKLRKNMARFLTLSILLNNIYFCSNANVSSSETLSRYETLEGEVITIDDSTEGELHEIEIFGNTVQDPDNLEDIESVGELYVDEEGESILDKQGREQYKIDIVSTNMEFDYSYYLNSEGKIVKQTYELENPIYVKEGDIFTLITQGTNTIDDYSRISFGEKEQIEWPNENSVLDTGVWYKSFYNNELKVLKLTGKKQGVITHMRFINCGYPDEYDVRQFKLIRGDFTNNIFNINEHKTIKTILLPCQLQKVGGVADRLYWDSGTGRYVIEKNINSFVVNDISLAHSSYIGEYNYAYYINFDYNDDLSHGVSYRHGYLITGLKDIIYSYYNPNSEPWSFDKWGTLSLLIRYPREDKFSTKEKTLEYLEENNVSLFYQTKNPQLIETNITSKLKIPTYDKKTHIYVNSGNRINPTLKVTVDRIEQVSQEAVDLAMSSPTSSNIALARMYVNLLSESLYKDQLQEQLNQLFSSDMVLERQSLTANLDVYIKSENMLSMSLDTNNITFEEYSGVEELELQDAINISINSSLPYSLNAYVVGDITNSDNSKTMDLDVLNIKDSDEVDYQKFDSINNKIVLKDSCNKGNNLNHAIDLKLSSNAAHKADIYKTTIKFEVEQK